MIYFANILEATYDEGKGICVDRNVKVTLFCKSIIISTASMTMKILLM